MTPNALHLILNPFAGHRKARSLATAIESELTRLGLDVTVRQSRRQGDIGEQARQAADAGIHQIAVAGGDGSVCEAVNGLMRSPTQAALGIIPVGTGNDFVKTAGLARDWPTACRDIALACTQQSPLPRVDIGVCNGHYFVNCLGIGLDARIALQANGLKHFGGHTVYLIALLKTLWKGIPRPAAKIQWDGQQLDQQVSLITICNGQVVGSLFKMAPGARVDDGLLDVVVAQGVSRMQALQLARKVIAGTHESLPQVRTLKTSHISVHLDEPTPIEADGEVISESAMALDVSVLPAALALLSPATGK